MRGRTLRPQSAGVRAGTSLRSEEVRMAWQYFIGVIVGGVAAGLVVVVLAQLFRLGGVSGALGFAAAAVQIGGLIAEVKTFSSIVALTGEGVGSRTDGWWTLVGVGAGAVLVLLVARGGSTAGSGAGSA